MFPSGTPRLDIRNEARRTGRGEDERGGREERGVAGGEAEERWGVEESLFRAHEEHVLEEVGDALRVHGVRQRPDLGVQARRRLLRLCIVDEQHLWRTTTAAAAAAATTTTTP